MGVNKSLKKLTNIFCGSQQKLKKIDQPSPQWLVLQLAVDDPLVALVDVHHCLKVHYECDVSSIK